MLFKFFVVSRMLMDAGCAAAVVSGVYCRLSLVAVVLLSVLVVVIDSVVLCE